ncbi:hypothetical protein AB1Y20_018139 [Prymnesium parvum]|uniref:Uncharacterized protein n=1 Tax=Prymnesium parvum TaxID=97485 RepID=A0AB34JM95_PRYPA
MRWLALLALLAIAAALLTGQRYSQLSLAAAREHERLVQAQTALDAERAALRAEREGRMHERRLCAAALPSREAVREAVRQLLREAAELASASSLPLHRVLDGGKAGERLLAQAELVRAELREESAAEEAGWCSCPPLPNLGLLCRALVPPASNQSAEWAEKARVAQAEAEFLREATTEARLRAQASSASTGRAADEALAEAEAVAAGTRRRADAATAARESCEAKLAQPKVTTADDCAPMVRVAQQLLAQAVSSHIEQLQTNLTQCKHGRSASYATSPPG